MLDKSVFGVNALAADSLANESKSRSNSPLSDDDLSGDGVLSDANVDTADDLSASVLADNDNVLLRTLLRTTNPCTVLATNNATTHRKAIIQVRVSVSSE
jgi:Trk K+ transport system NAD-binding subunit